MQDLLETMRSILCASIAVKNKTRWKMAKDAYFSHDTKVLEKEGLVKLKKQIRDFFKEFKKFDFSGLDADLVNQKLVAHNLHKDNFIQKFVVAPQK